MIDLSIKGLPKVHPRVCGEYLAIVLEVSILIGSPPRMRGIYIEGRRA